MQFLCSIWKILHLTEYFYTGTARGARNNYQVCHGGDLSNMRLLNGELKSCLINDPPGSYLDDPPYHLLNDTMNQPLNGPPDFLMSTSSS